MDNNIKNRIRRQAMNLGPAALQQGNASAGLLIHTLVTNPESAPETFVEAAAQAA